MTYIPPTYDQFAASLNSLTQPPAAQEQARGFLTPIMRAMGHLLYALAGSTATPPVLTAEEVHNEVIAAQTHLASGIFTALPLAEHPISILSASASFHLSLIVEKTGEITVNWPQLPEADRPRFLLTLINAYAGYTALLDRELAGIYYADPGSTL